MSVLPLRRMMSSAALGFALASFALPVFANGTAFSAAEQSTGWFYVQGEDTTRPVYPGSVVKVTGVRQKPGRKVTLQRGHLVLNETAAVADEKGSLSLTFTVPEDAAPGVHPLIVIFDEPSGAEIIDLRVSREAPLLGEADWSAESVKTAAGPYQSAYSASEDALFVAATSINPWESRLQKLNPETLAVVAEITPAPFAEGSVPADSKNRHAKSSVGVFGLALDEVNGTIWVTNTIHNTVAVYRQSDLALIHQFPMDLVNHAREVVVDPLRGRAYVSGAAANIIHVFDTKTLEKVDLWPIETTRREGTFASMGMDLDAESGRLFVTSRRSDELAVIDVTAGTVQKVIPLPGARNTLAVDFDAQSGKAFVASQDSDSLLILDVDTGAVDHLVTTGGGALSVTYDASLGRAFVANRTGGTVSIVTPEGEVVGNLPGGTHPNHVTGDGKGRVWLINKSATPADPLGDRISLIRPRAN